MNAMRKELDARGDNPYTLDVVKPAMQEIKRVVKGRIRTCMADGKA
jgi:hypothetical protein